MSSWSAGLNDCTPGSYSFSASHDPTSGWPVLLRDSRACASNSRRTVAHGPSRTAACRLVSPRASRRWPRPGSRRNARAHLPVARLGRYAWWTGHFGFLSSGEPEPRERSALKASCPASSGIATPLRWRASLLMRNIARAATSSGVPGGAGGCPAARAPGPRARIRDLWRLPPRRSVRGRWRSTGCPPDRSAAAMFCVMPTIPTSMPCTRSRRGHPADRRPRRGSR